MKVKHIVWLIFNCPISMRFTKHIEWAFRSIYANFLSNLIILSDNFKFLKNDWYGTLIVFFSLVVISYIHKIKGNLALRASTV